MNEPKHSNIHPYYAQYNIYYIFLNLKQFERNCAPRFFAHRNVVHKNELMIAMQIKCMNHK